jgi:hypothetical protein
MVKQGVTAGIHFLLLEALEGKRYGLIRRVVHGSKDTDPVRRVGWHEIRSWRDLLRAKGGCDRLLANQAVLKDME